MGQWDYASAPVEGGQRVSASVRSLLPLYIDGSAQHVQLVFSDDPVWGHDAALRLSSGDFDCALGCRVQYAIDGANEADVTASRPQSDEPTLSISGPRELWYAIRAGAVLTIDFPLSGAGTKRATFDVTGLDRSRLDWDMHRYAPKPGGEENA